MQSPLTGRSAVRNCAGQTTLHADAHAFDSHTSDLEEILEQFLVHTLDSLHASSMVYTSLAAAARHGGRLHIQWVLQPEASSLHQSDNKLLARYILISSIK